MNDDVKAALLLAETALQLLKEGKCWCAFTREFRQHHSAACNDAGEALAAIRIVLRLAPAPAPSVTLTEEAGDISRATAALVTRLAAAARVIQAARQLDMRPDSDVAADEFRESLAAYDALAATP